LAGIAGSLLLLILATATAWAGNATLAWSASPSGDIAGYNVYYGTQSGAYTTEVNAGPSLNVTVSNLTPGVTYYFAVTCYDSFGDESGYSNEIGFTLPSGTQPTLQLTVSAQKQVTLTASGQPGSTYNILALQNSAPWTVIGTATADSNGALQFVDPAGASNGICFYRLQFSH